MKLKSYWIVVFLFILQNFGFAQLRLPKILGNNMVLQCEKPVPVWGWAKAGETVSVSFAGQQKVAKADSSGYWKVILSALKTSAQPQTMLIAAGDTVKLTNILVGEVWLCSGQSNMEYTMKLGPGYAKPKKGIDSAAIEITKNHPNLRLFKVEKVLSTPDVTTTGWNDCSGTALEQFSAVGFYFAKNLQQALKDVPIGMITSAWGGSRIEPWTPAEAYQALPAFAPESQKTPFTIDSVAPGKDYRSMILPMAPFALRGFLWYQGESNCMINDGLRYADKMQTLVDGWRKQFGSNSLPFYSVEIAPYYYTKRKDHVPHTPETEAEFWEAQSQSLKIPHTDLIVVTDLIDNLADIHPPYKWEVGRRLALLALNHDYHKKVVSSGPIFKSMSVNNGKAILSFNNAAGLKSNDGNPLSWFTIAAQDGKFVPARAEIKGDKIEVSAAGIAKPQAVRFAWNETAMPNLVNAAGLPAVPFRTDGLTWNYKK